MRYTLLGDGRYYGLGVEPAETDVRPGECRYCPWETPAVAMKQRQGPKVDRVLAQTPCQRVANRIQICAAMMIYDAFGVPGRARRVIQRDSVPFVGRHQWIERRIAAFEKRFICKELGDVSDDRRILDNDEFDLNMQIVQRRPCKRKKFDVDDQHLGASVP